MKVLVACEFSGTVRNAFSRRGHDAWSCDLMETESPGNHIVGDVREVIRGDWDLIIAHPPCTYLTNSGVGHLYRDPEPGKVLGADRWEAMREGAAFFREFLEANCPRIAIENPIPHKYAVEEIGRKYDQRIQPWMFGHGESKATCLWLKNLPPLMATNVVDGRDQRLHRLPPGPDRWKERSKTYLGIAEAMATQWGNL